jgi:hypothetical protein
MEFYTHHSNSLLFAQTVEKIDLLIDIVSLCGVIWSNRVSILQDI